MKYYTKTKTLRPVSVLVRISHYTHPSEYPNADSYIYIYSKDSK